MLIKDLYKIRSFDAENNSIKAVIYIIKEHKIFAGHFPNNPVMPGVCMIQIIKELTEKVLGAKLFMSKATNVKFMALINPETNPEQVIDIQIEKVQNDLKVKSTFQFDETIALKFNGVFNPA